MWAIRPRTRQLNLDTTVGVADHAARVRERAQPGPPSGRIAKICWPFGLVPNGSQLETNSKVSVRPSWLWLLAKLKIGATPLARTQRTAPECRRLTRAKAGKLAQVAAQRVDREDLAGLQRVGAQRRICRGTQC